MIAYRPIRYTIQESMQAAIEFNTIDEMKDYIINDEDDDMLTREDIVIDYEDEPYCDDISNWKDCRDICVKKMNGEDCILKYGCPQAIGTFATLYKKWR